MIRTALSTPRTGGKLLGIPSGGPIREIACELAQGSSASIADRTRALTWLTERTMADALAGEFPGNAVNVRYCVKSFKLIQPFGRRETVDDELIANPQPAHRGIKFVLIIDVTGEYFNVSSPEHSTFS